MDFKMGKFTAPRAETIYRDTLVLQTFVTAMFFQLLLDGPKAGKAHYAKTTTIRHLESQKVNF
ncbi:hypothetical protein GHT06_005425 [Daphnia sinensis]|uniref:Uncharacterized protein n=1 Tax=Daphnia sinensis TaxID=1820382 RepID=A0AAD5PJR9_9CRUS|nr:hypothetical protein GHT06_005466 [Daphnia sinensis]KAI9550619.1 hypothetical protein GHT06_005425 [Daphnia sinensis]